MVYLIMYYSKYFEGNFFVNYSIQSLSNGGSLIWVGFLSKKFKIKDTLTFVVLTMIMLSIITIIMGKLIHEDTNLILLPVMIGLMRL